MTTTLFSHSFPLPLSFALFGKDHLITLGILTFIITWILSYAHKSSGDERTALEKLLIWALLGSFPLSLAYRLILDPTLPWQERLPFHLCSIIPYVGAYALISRSHYAKACAYYLGSILCLQALITPNITLDFPHPIYVEFFATHGIIILAALYFPIVQRWRAQKWDFVKVYAFAFVYMVSMLVINPLLGTNFGFVIHAPTNGSVLDLLGPWPWYLFLMQIPALFLLFLAGLPVQRKKNTSNTNHL